MTQKPTRFLGMDLSTQSIAFSVIDGDELLDWGEVKLNGATVWERLQSGKREAEMLVRSGRMRADVISFEAAVRVNNMAVALKLAYVFGAVVAEVMEAGGKIYDVPPVTWQKGIGNPPLTTKERAAVKAANPGRSKSWYSNAGRELRKQRTLTIVNTKFGKQIISDNIGDSIGVALYAQKQLG